MATELDWAQTHGCTDAMLGRFPRRGLFVVWSHAPLDHPLLPSGQQPPWLVSAVSPHGAALDVIGGGAALPQFVRLPLAGARRNGGAAGAAAARLSAVAGAVVVAAAAAVEADAPAAETVRTAAVAAVGWEAGLAGRVWTAKLVESDALHDQLALWCL